MIGSNKGNWGRYGLQAFGISVLGPLLFQVIEPIIGILKGIVMLCRIYKDIRKSVGQYKAHTT